MQFQNLLEVDYWFGQPFSAQGRSLWLLIGGFLLFVLAGLICKIAAQFQEEKYKTSVLKRFGTLGLTLGFFGLVWMFFRQEGVMLLSYRFWLLVWVIALGLWLYSIIKYLVTRVPEIKSEQDRRARIEKYLPKSSK